MHSFSNIGPKGGASFKSGVDAKQSQSTVGMVGVSSVVIASSGKPTIEHPVAANTPPFRLDGITIDDKASDTTTALLALNPKNEETTKATTSFQLDGVNFREETPQTISALLELNPQRSNATQTDSSAMQYCIDIPASDSLSDQITEATSDDEQDDQMDYIIALREARAQLLARFRRDLRLLRNQRSCNRNLIQKRNENRRRVAGKYGKNDPHHGPHSYQIRDPETVISRSNSWHAEGLCSSPISVEEGHEVAAVVAAVTPANQSVLRMDVAVPSATDKAPPPYSIVTASPDLSSN